MAEEVKIHVASDADTRAIAEAEAKIKQLYKTAAVYESKGIDAGAKQIRAEAHSYERDIARLKKEQLASEKLISVEQREQGTGLRGGRLGQVLRNTPAGARLGGEIGFAFMIGKQVQNAINQITDELEAASLKTQNSVIDDRAFSRHLRRESLTSGAGERTSFINSGEDKIDALQKEANELNEEKRKLARRKSQNASTFGPLGSFYNSLVVDPQLSANEGKQGQNFQQQEKLNSEIAKQKELRKQDIANQIEIAEATGRHDFSEVRRIQDKITWTKKFNDAKKEGASDDQAGELAGMEVFNEHQQRIQALAGRLVDARSGAGDTARAAQLADPNSDLRRSIDAMHHTMAGHLKQTNDHLSRETFT